MNKGISALAAAPDFVDHGAQETALCFRHASELERLVGHGRVRSVTTLRT